MPRRSPFVSGSRRTKPSPGAERPLQRVAGMQDTRGIPASLDLLRDIDAPWRAAQAVNHDGVRSSRETAA